MTLLYLFAILLFSILFICCYYTVADETIVHIVKNSTTEAEDMAKAMALRNTHFWQQMLLKWDCKKQWDAKTKNLLQSPEWRISVDLLRKCPDWEKMAMAADAYMRIFEWKNDMEKDNNNGPSILHALGLQNISPEHLGKAEAPMFKIGQDQLQISSAMEVLKAVYRVMFKKGQDNNLRIYFKMRFEIKKEWQPTISAVIKNCTSNAMQPSTKRVEEMYYEELSSATKTLRQLDKDLEKGQSTTTENVCAEIMKIWKIAQHLGMVFSKMCAGINEYRLNNSKSIWKMKLYDAFELLKIILMIKNKTREMTEQSLGLLFIVYINLGCDSSLVVKDPCEEAKLKVWQN